MQVFGSANDIRVNKLYASVQYYLNGTQEGFLRYQHTTGGGAVSYLPPELQRSVAALGGGGGSMNTAGRGCHVIHKQDFSAVSKESPRTGKEARSCSVPILVVTNEESSTINASSPDPSLPIVSPSTSPVSSVHSGGSPTPSLSSLSGSSALPSSSSARGNISFLTSSSPKLRTRRHNSVPLLRNIPIISEIIEEDASSNGSYDQQPRTRPSNFIGQGYSSALPESSSIRQYTAIRSVNTKATIGKNCPLIRINDNEVQEAASGFSGRCTASVQVPQILIEVSEAVEDDAGTVIPDTITTTPSTTPPHAVGVPSIDITAADDDTDVEEDLDDVDDIDVVHRSEDVPVISCVTCDDVAIATSVKDSKCGDTCFSAGSVVSLNTSEPDLAYECDDEDDDSELHLQDRNTSHDVSSLRHHLRRRKLGQIKKTFPEMSSGRGFELETTADSGSKARTASAEAIDQSNIVDASMPTNIKETTCKDFGKAISLPVSSAGSEPSTPTVPVSVTSRGSVPSLHSGASIGFKGSLLTSTSLAGLEGSASASCGKLSVPSLLSRKTSDESSVCSRRTSASSSAGLLLYSSDLIYTENIFT